MDRKENKGSNKRHRGNVDLTSLCFLRILYFCVLSFCVKNNMQL